MITMNLVWPKMDDPVVYAQRAERQLAAQIGSALTALHQAARERDALRAQIADYKSRYAEQDEQIRKLWERLGQLEVSLIETIRGVQRREGNFDCFATATSGVCDQTACLWRARCLKVSVSRRVAG